MVFVFVFITPVFPGYVLGEEVIIRKKDIKKTTTSPRYFLYQFIPHLAIMLTK